MDVDECGASALALATLTSASYTTARASTVTYNKP